MDGLYLPGFTATQDFGPFFGFVQRRPGRSHPDGQELDLTSRLRPKIVRT